MVVSVILVVSFLFTILSFESIRLNVKIPAIIINIPTITVLTISWLLDFFILETILVSKKFSSRLSSKSVLSSKLKKPSSSSIDISKVSACLSKSVTFFKSTTYSLFSKLLSSIIFFAKEINQSSNLSSGISSFLFQSSI